MPVSSMEKYSPVRITYTRAAGNVDEAKVDVNSDEDKELLSIFQTFTFSYLFFVSAQQDGRV